MRLAFLEEVCLIRKLVLRFVLLLSLIGIVYSTYSLIDYFNEYRVSAKKYEKLQQIHDSSEMLELYDRLKKINKDYVGWLTVDGTSIQYPVVHGHDNDFYLTHNFYKETDHAGAIFMDHRNSPNKLNTHTIIYGHNMKDKSMFASLANVLKDDFAEGNRIRFNVQNKTYEWEIFSAYVTRDVDWMDIDFESTNEYQQFLTQLMSKSVKSFQTEVNEQDHIITLATCTSRVSDERVIIHARLLKEHN